MAPQAAISSNVRQQPKHSRLSGSIWQILMQGVLIMGVT